MSGAMDDRTYWPEWLQNAATRNARVEIETDSHSDDVRVVWKGGTWEEGIWKGGAWESGFWESGIWERGIWNSGVWEGGVWEDGTWKGGAWEHGVWMGGVWEDGVWESGLWEGGAWKGGFWKGGVWKGGTWEDGWSIAGRSRWVPMVCGDRILIGCEEKTVAEWQAIIDGAEPPERAPERGSEEWRLLEASILAAIAYSEAMSKAR